MLSTSAAANEVNALFPHRLARLCREHAAHLVHLGTDCVFSGRKGNYAETDRPDPVDLYGESELLALAQAYEHAVGPQPRPDMAALRNWTEEEPKAAQGNPKKPA